MRSTSTVCHENTFITCEQHNPLIILEAECISSYSRYQELVLDWFPITTTLNNSLNDC